MLVYSFGSLSFKPKQGSRAVHFTVLAPVSSYVGWRVLPPGVTPNTLFGVVHQDSDKKAIHGEI